MPPHRPLPFVHLGCPGPDATPQRGTPGHKRGCIEPSKQRLGSAVAQRPSFDYWITRTRRSASTGPGHSAPAFSPATSVINTSAANTQVPLRHPTRLSRSRTTNFGSSAPSHRHQPATILSFRPARCWPVREPEEWFPRSLPNRLTGSVSSYAPPTSPRLRRRPSPWPPDRRHQPAKESPTYHCCVGVRRYAAPIRQHPAAGSLEELSNAGIFTYTFLSH